MRRGAVLGVSKRRSRLVAAVVGLAFVASACEATGYVYDEAGRLRAVSGASTRPVP